MKSKKAIELILLPKVFYTFKELKIKISILFSFMSKHWKLENKPYYLAYARTVSSWSNSRAWFLIVGQNSELKLMPNKGSRLILKGSRFKPHLVFPQAPISGSPNLAFTGIMTLSNFSSLSVLFSIVFQNSPLFRSKTASLLLRNKSRRYWLPFRELRATLCKDCVTL